MERNWRGQLVNKEVSWLEIFLKYLCIFLLYWFVIFIIATVLYNLYGHFKSVEYFYKSTKFKSIKFKKFLIIFSIVMFFILFVIFVSSIAAGFNLCYLFGDILFSKDDFLSTYNFYTNYIIFIYVFVIFTIFFIKFLQFLLEYISYILYNRQFCRVDQINRAKRIIHKLIDFLFK